MSGSLSMDRSNKKVVQAYRKHDELETLSLGVFTMYISIMLMAGDESNQGAYD